MVYYVTGSNIFGQWLCDDVILSEFKKITPRIHEVGKSLNKAKVLQINWSYNIFETDNSFYITGAWGGKEHQIFKIPSQEEWTKLELCIIGNDYNVLLIGKNVNTLWVIDVKKNETRKLQLLNEKPLENFVKKQKIDYSIIKAEINDDSCLYLTSGGNVYSGILSSYVDTRHCKGKIVDIKCGYEHFVLLTEQGVVYTWGNGRRLQLGHGDVSSQELPTEVEALAGIKIIKISAGGWHSLALSTFGDVYAWGWNDTGQIGIRNSNKEGNQSYSVPTLVDLFDEHGIEVEKNIKEIACGSRHSALILEDNTVWTTGCNKYGQLGLSVKKYSSLNFFRNVYHCDKDCSLKCGPWNTVIGIF